ncbi:MAG: radical SAM protein, partial [Candidatus Omnitrophica bacterium]|nr:radical SAM protein [Candidatus Omnitrophota bacterium]
MKLLAKSKSESGPSSSPIDFSAIKDFVSQHPFLTIIAAYLSWKLLKLIGKWHRTMAAIMYYRLKPQEIQQLKDRYPSFLKNISEYREVFCRLTGYRLNYGEWAEVLESVEFVHDRWEYIYNPQGSISLRYYVMPVNPYTPARLVIKKMLIYPHFIERLGLLYEVWPEMATEILDAMFTHEEGHLRNYRDFMKGSISKERLAENDEKLAFDYLKQEKGQRAIALASCWFQAYLHPSYELERHPREYFSEFKPLFLVLTNEVLELILATEREYQSKLALYKSKGTSSPIGQIITDSEGTIYALVIKKGEFGLTRSDLPLQLEVRRVNEAFGASDWLGQEIIFVEEGKLAVRIAGVTEELSLGRRDLAGILGRKWTAYPLQESIVSIVRQTPYSTAVIDHSVLINPIAPEHEIIRDREGLAAVVLRGAFNPEKLGVASHVSFPIGIEVKKPAEGTIGKPHAHITSKEIGHSQPKMEVYFAREGVHIFIIHKLHIRGAEILGEKIAELKLEEGDKIITPYGRTPQEHPAGHNVIFADEAVMLAMVEGPFIDTKENPAKTSYKEIDQDLVSSPLIKIDNSKDEKLAGLLMSDSYCSDVSTQQEALALLEGVTGDSNIETSATILRVTANVLRELLLSPVAKSREITEKLNLSLGELLIAYRIIRSIPGLHYSLIDRSNFSGVAGEVEHQLEHKDYLLKMFSKRGVVYPLIVEFHPGEWCPYRCVFCYTRHGECPRYYQDRKFGRKPLTPQRARELVRAFASGGTKEIWMSGGLEPLTTPVSWNVLDEAHKLGLYTKLYTNGQLLEGKALRVALESGWARFSIAAITEEMFGVMHRPIRKEFTFGRAVRNIEGLVRQRGESKKPEIGISYLIIPEPTNYKDIVGAADWASALKVDFLAIRIDMGNVMCSFNEIGIREILRQIEIIIENQRNGKYGKMKLDLRGTTEADLRGEEKFLTG